MQTTVFCKTTAKAKQSYFVRVDGRDYFLFQQDFRKSNKEFFHKGVDINAINDYSGVHSTSVRKTLDKLPVYIRYIEKEYDVVIYEKTKQKQSLKKKKSSKVKSFRWQDLEWEVA